MEQVQRLFGGGVKRQRPFFKLCTKCHGKGQTSSFNGQQEKVYDACDKCTESHDNTGLGVTLKCACQHVSTPYKYVRACDVKHLKGLDADLAEALLELQGGLKAGSSTSAVLLQCDCGASYLATDWGGRRKISGDASRNAKDKEHNIAIAQALVASGIVRTLRPPRR